MRHAVGLVAIEKQDLVRIGNDFVAPLPLEERAGTHENDLVGFTPFLTSVPSAIRSAANIRDAYDSAAIARNDLQLRHHTPISAETALSAQASQILAVSHLTVQFSHGRLKAPMKFATVLLCFVASLALISQAKAEVMIYKFVQTNTWTGDGVKFKQKVTGRIVFDPASALDNTKVITFLPQSRFQVDCPYMAVKYMRGPGRNGDQSAFFLDGVGSDELGNEVSIVYSYLRGTNSSLLIGVDSHITAPRVSRGIYRASYTAASGEVFVGEGNIVATFYSGETLDANANFLTVDQVIERYREAYLGQGWVEVIGDAPCQ